MNTVHTLTKQLTNPHAIMEKVTDLLRDLDPDYAGEEKAFQNACNRLTEEIGEFLSPSAQEYLRALEEEFVSDILFVTYQGFHLNLDIFRDPVHALALQFDYEDLHQERRMPTLPMADRAIQTSSAFLKVLRASHPDKLNLLDDVKDFYCYMRTVGYKLAHYYGFCLADQLLPYLIPGYFQDSVFVSAYSMRLEQDLGFSVSTIIGS